MIDGRFVGKFFSLCAVGWIACGGWMFPSPNGVQQDSPKFRSVVLIELHGVIDDSMLRYFNQRLAKARSLGADLLVVEIDSPGGLKTVSLTIAETLRDVDWARTVAFVPKAAISGGALVALGCDEIVGDAQMIFGDIGEIFADPEFFAFRFVPAKIHSVLVRQARDLADAKGRPPELAEAMIDKDALVYGQRAEGGSGWEFRVVRADDQNPPQAPWQLVVEAGPERFLTVNGRRAVELGLADALVAHRDELATRYGVNAGAITVMSYGFTDGLVDWLVNPWITLLLVALGVLALYLELSAPGVGVGAVVAAVCAALFFWSRFLGGTADWLEVILFLAGLAFLGMEIFVIPGWGLSGILGVICLGTSFVMAGQDFGWPSTQYQWHQTLTSLLVLLGSLCVVVFGGVFIAKRVGHIPVLNRLVLEPRLEGAEESSLDKPKSDGKKPGTGAHYGWVALGDAGDAVTVLRPAGRVRFAGRSIDVISDGDFIEPGTRVKVVKIQGNVIIVTAAPPERTEGEQPA